MRKFNYRLQKIEDFRKEQLRAAQKELKKVRDELKTEKEALNLLACHQEGYRARLKGKSPEFIDVRELNWYKEYLHLLEVKIKEKKENLKALRQSLIRLKRLENKKDKEKKTLEKAKQIKFTEFLTELRKAEHKELDEICRMISSKKV